MATTFQAVVDPSLVHGLTLGYDAQRGVVEVGTLTLVERVIQPERVFVSELSAVLYVIGDLAGLVLREGA